MKKKERLDKVKKWYRLFRHNLAYKEGYFTKVMIIILTILVLDLIMLYFVW